MEWDLAAIEKLHLLFVEKHAVMRRDSKTDRSNMSAIWNKYVGGYGARVIRSESKSHNKMAQKEHVVKSIVDMLNYMNEEVSGGLLIKNPDRFDQYILISREIAERILVFGMI